MDKKNLKLFFQSTNLVSLSMAEEVADIFEYKAIAKNHFLLTEGKIADEYLFLNKGYMRSFVLDVKGNEVTTNFFKPKEIIFEASSFFNRNPSKENIQALTDCDGWFISFKQLNELFHSSPQFRELGRAILVKNFSGLKTRVLSAITETAEERYRSLLKNNPEIFQHAALKHIATYLGITDTSLSRIRASTLKK